MSSSALQARLKELLRQFIAAAATRDPDRIGSLLAELEGVQAELGPDSHPMLRHYLERRSYQKALELLDSGRPETESPQCGG
jgi:hypothetical protein